MTRARFNSSVYLLEGINAVATALYFNYLFFLLKSEHGFSNKENLLVAALNGLIFVPSAIWGGRFGQKRGYLNALVAGCVVMIIALVSATFFRTAPGLIITMVIWTVGMCFSWPNLEALISDRQETRKLPGVLGIYNVVWSGGGAIAYFSGGAIVEAVGWGSIFWIPVGLNIVLLGLALSLRPTWNRVVANTPVKNGGDLDDHHPEGPAFLKMAWLANPFAYIAINTAVSLIPDLAARLELSPKFAGFFCSIWFFSRMITFAILALWSGWHYRFGYLAAAYLGTMASFAAMLLLENLWAIIFVQVAFGWCIGLIYYSSLYYSMHVGETKGEHGGIHEAAIGAGIFGGPAIGAAALSLFPRYSQSSVVGVVLAMGVGFGLLVWFRSKR